MDTLINEIRTLQALRDEADNMRQPEANLEAEIDRETQKLHASPCYDELRNFARHFYVLGAKSRPVPSDVQEAANQYIGYPHEVDEGVSTSMRRDAYADGMLAERERLMSGALRGYVAMCGVTAWVKLPSKELINYLRSNFKEGDEVIVIIIKKEK